MKDDTKITRPDLPIITRSENDRPTHPPLTTEYEQLAIDEERELFKNAEPPALFEALFRKLDRVVVQFAQLVAVRDEERDHAGALRDIKISTALADIAGDVSGFMGGLSNLTTEVSKLGTRQDVIEKDVAWLRKRETDLTKELAEVRKEIAQLRSARKPA